MTRRLAVLPAASRVAICTRVASLPRRASAATPAASGIDSVLRCPPRRLRLFDPRTSAARTRRTRIVLAVVSVTVVWHPPVSAAGHDSGTRATRRPRLRTTRIFPRVGTSARRVGDGRRGGVDRFDSVDRVDRQRVGLGAVIAGAAADEVALAVAGEQPVVAVLAIEQVAAPAAVQRVVAGAADEAVGLLGPGQRVVARPAVGGDEQAWQAGRDRELVVAALTVDRQRLCGEVDGERHEVRAVDRRSRAVRPDRERVAGRRRPVDLDNVEARVAVRDVRAVAVVPDERVVAVAAAERVGATVANDAVVAAVAVQLVVAVAAGDQVGAVAPGEQVVAGAAVQRQERERREPCGAVEHVVAAEAVDRQPFGAEVDREGHQVRAVEQHAAGRSGRPC